MLFGLGLLLLADISQALKLEDAVRPGCTVGLVSDKSNEASLVGQFLALGSHDMVVYTSGREAFDSQTPLREINRRCIDWILPGRLYHEGYIPVRGRNSRHIFLIRDSHVTGYDNSSDILDAVLLLSYRNETRPLLEVACPYNKENSRARWHKKKAITLRRNKAVTVRGKLVVDLEEFYKQKPYKFCSDSGHGFYSGQQVGIFDRTSPESKAMVGELASMLTNEVIHAVKGRPLGIGNTTGSITNQLVSGHILIMVGSTFSIYLSPNLDFGVPYTAEHAYLLGAKPGYASQQHNLWNTMDLSTWILLLATLTCLAAAFLLIGMTYSIDGHYYDYFELVTLAVKIMMAETSNVFSNTNNYPLSGVLLRGVSALMLPILLYGFCGNLKASLAIKRSPALPATLDECFKLDMPIYGYFSYHLKNEDMFAPNSKEGKIIKNVKKHDSSIGLLDDLILLEAMVNRTKSIVLGTNMTVNPDEAFLMIATHSELLFRDLYMLDDQDRDDSFHLDIVKEPFLDIYPAVSVKKYLDQAEELLEAGDILTEAGIIDVLKYKFQVEKPKLKYVAPKPEEKINIDHIYHVGLFAFATLVISIVIFITEVFLGKIRAGGIMADMESVDKNIAPKRKLKKTLTINICITKIKIEVTMG